MITTLQIVAALLLLLNQDRSGIPALTYCDNLQTFATTRAQEQESWNHLSHFVGGNLAIMEISTPGYGMIGENLAGADGTIEPVAFNNALMNSPQHRRNILEPSFTCVVIGVNDNQTILSEIFGQELSKM